MNLEKDFLEGKKSALEKLKNACTSSEVDNEILPILDIINKKNDYFTSSSCFGRIVVLEIPIIGDKKNAKFLGKWHREVIYDELLGSINKAKEGQIWLLSQSPVIHIISRTPESADVMLKTAISCGFKHSGLKSFGKKNVVEICSTERLDAPVGKDGKLFCNEDHLWLLLDISNEIIKKSTQKLKRLEKSLREL